MTPQTDVAADASRDAKPFGLIGLCLSLAAVLAFALLATALFGGLEVLIVGLTMGLHAMTEIATEVRAGKPAGAGTLALLGLILVFYCALALAVLLAARWRGGGTWRTLIGWRRFSLADWVIWAIMAAALIYSAVADAIFGHFLAHPSVQLAIPTDLGAAAALFVLAVVVAPVTEELVFRGWIYTGLRCHWGLWPALLTTSVMFALAHYEDTHVYALAVFPIGFALAVIRERSGSVKAAILFHAINNCAAFGLSALSGG